MNRWIAYCSVAAALIIGPGLVTLVAGFEAEPEHVVRFRVSSRAEVGELQELGYTVRNVRGLTVETLLSSEQLEEARSLGLEPELVYERPEERFWFLDGADQFHDYATMTAELQQIAADHPDIAALYDYGESVEGRTIWALRVSDNAEIEENEPEVRITGLHHGDELMSTEMPLELANHLTDNYGVIQRITDLVDGRGIWIVPMVNPDGREATPWPTRRNANNVDLNRDYGYMWNGSGNSWGYYSQPETQVMRRLALDHPAVLSLSYHTSGDIVNYVWNYKGQPVPDEALVVELSEQYAFYNGYWVVEGYDWYQTRGDANDFAYGTLGDIDWTIELANNNIPQVWDLNRDAMLMIIEEAGNGIEGVVTDATTGDSLAAMVTVVETGWPIFTDPELGDYHRALLPGTYSVQYWASGYAETTISGIVVPDTGSVVVDVALEPGGPRNAAGVVACNFYDPYSYPNNYQNNPTDAVFALGPPDGQVASLGVNGEILLDMGAGGMIYDGPGDDFTVHEGMEPAEGYEVSASDAWNGPWLAVGSGLGTASFDLAATGLDSCRYLKIEDDGGGSPFVNYPGFDLDAIESFPRVPVGVTVLPDSTSIHRGGQLSYRAILTNNSASSQSVYYRGMLRLPSGNPYPGNPLDGPQAIDLEPYESDTMSYAHQVPMMAPFGTYKYRGQVGVPPATLYDQDILEFEVVP